MAVVAVGAVRRRVVYPRVGVAPDDRRGARVVAVTYHSEGPVAARLREEAVQHDFYACVRDRGVDWCDDVQRR